MKQNEDRTSTGGSVTASNSYKSEFEQWMSANCKLLKTSEDQNSNISFPGFHKGAHIASDDNGIAEESRNQLQTVPLVTPLDAIINPSLRQDRRVSLLNDLAQVSDESFCALTGLPNLQSFSQLFHFLDCAKICPSMCYWDVDACKWVSRMCLYNVKKNFCPLSWDDELLMALMKLKLNATDEDLSIRFRCSKRIVQSICQTWVQFIFIHFTTQKKLPMWPPRHKVDSKMPRVFASDYEFKFLRAVLVAVDVLGEKQTTATPYQVEPFVFTAVPSSKVWNCVIGLTPNGAVNYISSLCPRGEPPQTTGGASAGSASSLELSHPDQSLEVFQNLKPRLCKDDLLVGPPNLSSTTSWCYESMEVDYMTINDCLASTPALSVPLKHLAFTFVNRLLSFKILSCIPPDLHSSAHQIVTICAILTNLHPPIFDKA